MKTGLNAAKEDLSRLNQYLSSYSTLGVAVSGGIDSLTLATVCHRHPKVDAHMFHAVSPAVPDIATKRFIDYAQRFGWKHTVVETGEFRDPEYIKNPANRCYYCKSNLYWTIGQRFAGPIASGTNIDDLRDFRPGLKAAAAKSVVHPFVEANIDKIQLRNIAASLEIAEIADIAAQPCLASRVETAIPIRRTDLLWIDRIETLVRSEFGDGDLRCRLRKNGVWLEVAPEILESIKQRPDSTAFQQLVSWIDAWGHEFRGIRNYEKGSTFIR